jgi:general secretion pathway protein D
MIKKIVEQVDQLHAQVLIEAIIMEVRRSDEQSYGVSWLQNPGKAGDLRGGGAIANHSVGRMIGGREFLDTGGAAAEGILGQGGFSYFARAGNTLEATVSAIASDASIDVLSRPRIQTSHAVPASFLLGESVPYITGFDDFGLVGQTRTRTQVQEREILFRLDVTPFITPDGLVVMEINQTFDSRGEDRFIDENAFPVINRREVMSTLSAQDGDTILIGGFITQNKLKAKSGVPILKDIPILGAAFRTQRNNNDRSELIVLIRPTVLTSPQIAAVVADEERAMLPGVSQAEMEMELDRQERMRRFEEDYRRHQERQIRRERLGIR